MKKIIKSFVQIFCVFLLLSFIAADCSVKPPTELILNVTFVNNSSEPVHLYGNNESAGPGNRLEQGASRTKKFIFEKEGETKIFTAYAFRNGTVISKKEYKVTKLEADLTVSYPW